MTTPNSNIPPQGTGRKSQQGATERDDARLTFLVERAFLDGAPSPDVETAFRACRRQVEGTEITAGDNGDAEATPSRWTVVWKVMAALAASLLLLITFARKDLLRPDSSSAPAVVLRKMPTIDDAHQRGGVSIAAGSMTLTTTTAQAHCITVLPDNIIKVEHTTQQEAETYTLRVAEGKTAQLLLPDGTHVWLSVGSEIAFSNHFGQGAPRRVALRGEAFFDVHHDATAPFTVDAGDCRTTVYGTRFNVRNIEGDAPQVTLVSGKVGVSYHRSWKNGHFYFDGQTLRDIVSEIGRWYGMPVSYMSDADINTRLHFNAERSWPVTRVIDELNKISHTKVEIRDNRLRID